MNTLVLLSGGIDSSCCVAFFREMAHAVTGVFVDYGQPVSRKEEECAGAIAGHYNIPFHIIRSSGPSTDFRGEIAGRNAFLVFVALLYVPQFTGLLALGIHGGTTYYDCSEHFANHLSTILAGYRSGAVTLATPFLKWNKSMIYDFAVEHRVPIQLTWSCEVGPSNACGRCLSCKDREHLNVRTQE
ncbi:MAG: 7-cyano-7-deazaguanine synthase [Terriglobia bacterium]